jgi:TctA family transporter
MFWIASGLSLLIGILIVIVLFMLLSTPRTDNGWAWTIALFAISVWIGFVILSLGLNTGRRCSGRSIRRART